MSSSNPIIAIDAMGGDYGPEGTIPAAALALAENPDLKFLFYGDKDRIAAQLDCHQTLKNISEIHHTDRVVSSAEKPSAALRSGKDSSMRLAIDAVAGGKAACAVSAGNTGALMAMAKLALRCLPGIHRPAIASLLPTRRGSTVMLDLGANIECDAEILTQFAIMGAVYARVVRGIENPTVALLNVGSEEMKGHEEIRAAAAMLANMSLPGKFAGFVEGNDIPAGKVDVVATDGFTGNVALKVAEGVGTLSAGFMKEAFMSSLPARLGALLAAGALRKFRQRTDPRYYNGGMFLGLDGICVKSHGGMDAYGFSRAILVAADLARKGYNRRVAAEIRHLMGQGTSAAPPADGNGSLH